MENKKVVLPQNVASAIQILQNKFGWRISNFLDIEWMKEYESPGSNSYTILNYVRQVGLETYFSAIINGYEIEKELTPEEKVKTIYEIFPHKRITGIVNIYDVYKLGIKDCLNALEMQIEGVNK